MDMMELAKLILPPEEYGELREAVGLLESGRFATFYEKYPGIVLSVLFIDNLEEFLDFSKENTLDRECVCAAFLCGKGYGLSVGGYEDDLTQALVGFLQGRGAAAPEALEILQRERVYTDCGDFDNFKRTLSEVNQVLEGQGVRLAVWEDFVYCDCEYTLLLLDRAVEERVHAGWRSESFMIYL